MDLEEPGRGFSGSLTMPILRALAARSSPVSAAQLRRVAGVGTEAGVRRAVERLSRHGICLREEIAGQVAYSLNYEHILYKAVTDLLRADRELVRRLKGKLAGWEPAPVSGVLFGSAARGDGDIDSDIDLLLVRPPLMTNRKRQWNRQVHELRGQVKGWTGNNLQILDRSRPEVRRLATADEPLIEELLEDGITVSGISIAEFLALAG